MTVEEIFSRLSTHMVNGLMLHNQLASGFAFLNLEGYKKCHEYQYLEESFNYRCLQDYFLAYHNKLIPETKIDNTNVIPNTWYKYTQMDVDTNTKRSAIRDMFKAWVEWEKEAKQLLETSYKELYDLGEICAAMKIAWFLKNTSKELKHAQEHQIYLENLNYDICHIIEEQKELKKKYIKKIKCIYSEGDK